SFYYILLTLFLSLTFLLYPGRVGDAEKVPWYDWLLFLATVCTTAWLAWNGGRIVAEGWDIAAPTDATILAGIVCVLALEALRRAGGIVLFVLCTFFMLYPLFSEDLPGFLWGPSTDL